MVIEAGTVRFSDRGIFGLLAVAVLSPVEGAMQSQLPRAARREKNREQLRGLSRGLLPAVVDHFSDARPACDSKAPAGGGDPEDEDYGLDRPVSTEGLVAIPAVVLVV